MVFFYLERSRVLIVGAYTGSVLVAFKLTVVVKGDGTYDIDLEARYFICKFLHLAIF